MILVFMITGLIICERIILSLYKKNWNKNINAEVYFCDECVSEGDSGDILEKISNKKYLPLPVAAVKFELDKNIHYQEKNNIIVSDKQYRSDIMTIGSYKQINRKFKVTYAKRGVYTINSVSLNIRDILSTYNMSETYTSNSEIYVYPSYSHYRDVIAPFSKVVGEALKNRFLFEDPFEFKGIRDYTGTEPMKKINWSASAKTGNLMVNNYYDTTSRHITIFLDIVNDLIWKRDDQVEECIRITRNYLEGFNRNQIPVNIVTNGLDYLDGSKIVFENGTGAGVVESCLKKLSRIDINHKTERLVAYLEENSAKPDELTILLSADTSSDMTRAYEKYLGNNQGEWIAPILVGAEREIHSRMINVTYVEVSR